MPPTNPFFALQERLRGLIAAADYFAGLQDTQILTERIGNLDYAVDNSLLPTGFGVVITTAEGKATENEFETLMTIEDLNISVISNPSLDPDHYALAGVYAIIKAIHNQSVQAEAPPAARPFDFFRVTGHERRNDSPPGVHTHEVHVIGGLRLL